MRVKCCWMKCSSKIDFFFFFFLMIRYMFFVCFFFYLSQIHNGFILSMQLVVYSKLLMKVTHYCTLTGSIDFSFNMSVVSLWLSFLRQKFILTNKECDIKEFSGTKIAGRSLWGSRYFVGTGEKIAWDSWVTEKVLPQDMLLLMLLF